MLLIINSNRDAKVLMFAQHRQAEGYTAVIYGSGRVLMGRANGKKISASCWSAAAPHVKHHTVYCILCVGYTVFTTAAAPPSTNLCLLKMLTLKKIVIAQRLRWSWRTFLRLHKEAFYTHKNTFMPTLSFTVHRC